MTIERLRALYEATPFRPFVIHLADGKVISVRSREFMASAPNGRTIVVYEPEDTMNIVDVLMITKLEIEHASNGGRRRRHV